MQSAQAPTPFASDAKRGFSIVALGATAAHLALVLLFSIPSVRDTAKEWTWAWSPVGDWSIAMVVVPFTLAIVASILTFRLHGPALVFINILATLGWGWVLFLQLTSTSTID